MPRVYNSSTMIFMAAETTTVRVRRPDSERLQSLAKARQTAVIDVVHAAIDALERQEFLRGLTGTTSACAAILTCGSNTWPSARSGTCIGLIWRGGLSRRPRSTSRTRASLSAPGGGGVSVDILNNGPGGLVVVVPVTTAGYGLRSHVELEPASSGLDHTSLCVRCDQLRVVSIERLSSRQGMISPEQMQAVDQALRFVLIWRDGGGAWSIRNQLACRAIRTYLT